MVVSFSFVFSCLILISSSIWGLNASNLLRNDDETTNKTELPNIIIMLMDDMGWGDLGIFGEPNKETPNLDQMANEGVILTDFYTANPLCSPSRAALMTGRLPIRNGFYTDNGHARNAYTSEDIVGGINDWEILLPELLSEKGYTNKIIGKWHLGNSNQFLPLNHGFQEFYGSPDVHIGPFNDSVTPNIPFYKNDKMIGRYWEEFKIDEKTRVSNITMLFIEEALLFITKQFEKSEPFFLYWAPDSTHSPVYASSKFRGKSRRGLYGDAVMELDYGVGLILNLLKSLKIDENTLVVFTSDNGPALMFKTEGGSNGPLLCGKQTTFEGGMREPTIAWWPGKIKPQSVNHQAATIMDLFATALELADIPLPKDRVIDGISLVHSLTTGETQNRPVFYYRGNELMAVRYGLYKAHFWCWSNPWSEYNNGMDNCPGQNIRGITSHIQRNYTSSPIMYHLGRDIAERFPINNETEEYKNAYERIMIEVNIHRANLTFGKPVLNWCDTAAEPWAPFGCELINKCLKVPPSDLHLCVWPY